MKCAELASPNVVLSDGAARVTAPINPSAAVETVIVAAIKELRKVCTASTSILDGPKELPATARANQRVPGAPAAWDCAAASAAKRLDTTAEWQGLKAPAAT